MPPLRSAHFLPSECASGRWRDNDAVVSTLVVVDGANLMNEVGRYLSTVPTTADDATQRRYFSEWFDIDRLIAATLGEELKLSPYKDLGIVIVHSLRGIGDEGSLWRIEQTKATEPFWARQGAAPNTSTLLVQVKGPKEKGVDTAIVVYMFETIDQWSSAVIFSNDADYVPAVWSLRRKGKRVYCAASDSSSPLVQACQTFLPWHEDFLRADRALFHFLQKGGGLDQLFEDSFVKSQRPPDSITVDGGWLRLEASYGGNGENRLNEILRSTQLYAQELRTSGSPLSLRIQPAKLPRLGPDYIKGSWHVLEGLRRHHASCADANWYKYFRESD